MHASWLKAQWILVLLGTIYIVHPSMHLFTDGLDGLIQGYLVHEHCCNHSDRVQGECSTVYVCLCPFNHCHLSILIWPLPTKVRKSWSDSTAFAGCFIMHGSKLISVVFMMVVALEMSMLLLDGVNGVFNISWVSYTVPYALGWLPESTRSTGGWTV